MRLSFRFFLIFLNIGFFLQTFGQDQDRSTAFANKELDSTFFLYKKQLKLAQIDSRAIIIARKHWVLGKFYFNVGVFSEAMGHFNKALILLDRFPKDTLQITVKNSMGRVALSLKNYNQAMSYFVEAIKKSKKMGYIRGQAISKGFLGTCFEKKGEYAEALKYQNESLEQFQLIHDIEGLSLVNENIGSIYEDQENYALAKEYFIVAYDYVKDSNNADEANILNNLGDVHRKKGDYENGLFYTEKALAIAKKIKDNHQVESAYKDLSKTYVLLGDYKKAFSHLKESEKINEEIFYAQNTNQLNVLQTVYNTNKKEATIKLLEQESKVRSARQNLLLVIVCSLLAVLGGVFVFVRKKRKIQEYRQLILKAELEKKEIEEENLQKEIHLKTAALSKYSLHLSQKNKILSDLSATLTNLADRKNMNTSEKLKGLVKEINFDLKQDKVWDEFIYFFGDIHPNFIKNLSALSKDNLSPAELRLGMLLRLNLSSKEIASILRVTPDSIRVARHRLRKKLNLNQKEELITFLIAL